LNRFGISSLSAIIDRITGGDPDARICHVAAELGLVPRPDTRDGYLWNGYPVSFRIVSAGESAEPSWIVVEICTGAAGKLQIEKSSWWTSLRHRRRGADGSHIESGLKVISEPEELGARLISEPVMAKTLPWALSRHGEIRMSDGRLRVTRYCVDRVAEDALKAGWSLATGVVQVLELLPL
jgi:hypothetical protein